MYFLISLMLFSSVVTGLNFLVISVTYLKHNPDISTVGKKFKPTYRCVATRRS